METCFRYSAPDGPVPAYGYLIAASLCARGFANLRCVTGSIELLRWWCAMLQTVTFWRRPLPVAACHSTPLGSTFFKLGEKSFQNFMPRHGKQTWLVEWAWNMSQFNCCWTPLINTSICQLNFHFGKCMKIYTEFNKKCACTNETAACNLCNERLGVLW